jgi:predicted phosphoribosyltransferase
MYFRDRHEAGDLLAEELLKYRFEPTSVLALSPGGVAVGEQIAKHLHCTLSLLLTARISAPGDESLVLGTLDQSGVFTYNSMISAGQMEEYLEDTRTYLEEEKLRHLYQMTTLLGQNGDNNMDRLHNTNVIIATDGVKNGISYDAAINYLHHVPFKKAIAAIPVGPAEVIERVHGLVNELHYLYIPDNFIRVSHYYTDEPEIDPTTVIDRLNNVQANWV